jgi:hypothetical protein
VQSEIYELLKDALLRAEGCKGVVESVLVQADSSAKANTPQDIQEAAALGGVEDNKIYEALGSLSEAVAKSYAQVKKDILDTNRLSWAGTAHEIREILTTTLRLLAPDGDVISQPWYQQEPGTSSPTQKQRVRFILQKRNAGSKEQEVVNNVVHLEDMIGDMVRATYSRASDAAHRFKARKEVMRILRYFEAFANDLLDLD